MKILYPFECDKICDIVGETRKLLAETDKQMNSIIRHIKDRLENSIENDPITCLQDLSKNAGRAAQSCMYTQRLIQDAFAILKGGRDEYDHMLFPVKDPDPRIATLVDDSTIVLRFSIIPRESTSSYKNDVEDLSSYYHADLVAALDQLNAKQIFPLGNGSIRLQYMHIYPESTPTSSLIDNDNHAYKHYTDLITTCLGRSDGALECSFVYDTFCVDESLSKLSGSYVVVTTSDTPHMSKARLLEVIQGSCLSEYKGCEPPSQTEE